LTADLPLADGLPAAVKQGEAGRRKSDSERGVGFFAALTALGLHLFLLQGAGFLFNEKQAKVCSNKGR
jgi:hypothetical protein